MVNMDAEKLMMQKRIDNLMEQLELVKRERDAAIAALDEIRHCGMRHTLTAKDAMEKAVADDGN